MNNGVQRQKQDVGCGQVLHICGWLAGNTDTWVQQALWLFRSRTISDSFVMLSTVARTTYLVATGLKDKDTRLFTLHFLISRSLRNFPFCILPWVHFLPANELSKTCCMYITDNHLFLKYSAVYENKRTHRHWRILISDNQVTLRVLSSLKLT